MGQYRFAYLDTAHIPLGHIADHIPRGDDFSVCEGQCIVDRIDIGDRISFILLHLFGKTVQVVAHADDPRFAVDGFIVADLHLDARHRELVIVKDSQVQPRVALLSRVYLGSFCFMINF